MRKIANFYQNIQINTCFDFEVYALYSISVIEEKGMLPIGERKERQRETIKNWEYFNWFNRADDLIAQVG